MRPSIIKISIVLILVTCLIVSIAIYFNEDNKNFKIEADCGMEDGPIYGRKIKSNVLSMVVNINIPVKGGELFICNTPADDLELDSLAPVLYKVDSNYHVLWAVELVSHYDVKLYSIEDCRLFGHELHFFNSTHLEPGVIYLDENFDFKYMCLSMF
jgi:hypothetical protein